MEIIIIVVLVAIAAYIFGDMFGFDRGYRAGEQQGKLDQHLYNQRVEEKRSKYDRHKVKKDGFE